MVEHKINNKYKDRVFRVIFHEKKDLSFIIGDVMNLYEHQSSFSPNLPLRGLFYFSSLYRDYIEPVKYRLYSTSPLHIPFPQYIVFYNGTKKEPERQ